MKKIILFFALSVLICIQNRLNAQSTWNFVHTSWSMSIPDGFGGISGYSNIRLDSLNEDTIINSISYKKIIENVHSPGYLYHYSIRSENHKVYGRGNNPSFGLFPLGEYLLYDFTANIGDTIRKVAIGEDFLRDTVDLYVTDKDSFLLNNKYYITLEVYQVGGGGIQTIWYENIGCPNGLLTSSAGINGPSLACYSNKDSLVDIGYLPTGNIHLPDTIPTHPGGNCYYELHIGIEEITQNNEISIYPNPATNEFQVTSSKFKINMVSIFNVLGEEIQSFNSSTGSLQAELRMAPNESATIDISSYAKGIYFVEVQTEEGVMRKKIIKE